jgi:hypothetical protein
MSIALATKGIICMGELLQGDTVYYYCCVDLPDVAMSKDMSPDLKTAEDLSPRLSIKESYS